LKHSTFAKPAAVVRELLRAKEDEQAKRIVLEKIRAIKGMELDMASGRIAVK
jgi:hypothetical protein